MLEYFNGIPCSFLIVSNPQPNKCLRKLSVVTVGCVGVGGRLDSPVGCCVEIKAVKALITCCGRGEPGLRSCFRKPKIFL